MWRVDPLQILTAIGLDLLLGDPRGWPHIARLAGALSGFYEKLLTRFFRRTVWLGVMFWILSCGTMLALYVAAYEACRRISPAAAWMLEIAVLYQAIAAMDLARHVKAVLQPLQSRDFTSARDRLGWIVGRDTALLGESEISRATVESVAESTNDAIVAPLFWGMLAGAPGALIYRTVNTLDSMVGHRAERYEKFGKASARMDDLMNWIPARLCALAFCLLRPALHWRAIRREASAHGSPNAGWTEAAMAHAIGVRLGGDNFYDGVCVSGPVFNSAGRTAEPSDIAASLSWMWRITSLITSAFVLSLWLMNFATK